MRVGWGPKSNHNQSFSQITITSNSIMQNVLGNHHKTRPNRHHRFIDFIASSTYYTLQSHTRHFHLITNYSRIQQSIGLKIIETEPTKGVLVHDLIDSLCSLQKLNFCTWFQGISWNWRITYSWIPRQIISNTMNKSKSN